MYPTAKQIRKRASYREGITWIAYNDEPEDRDVDSVATLISVNLLAALFDRDIVTVAQAVVALRKRDDI